MILLIPNHQQDWRNSQPKNFINEYGYKLCSLVSHFSSKLSSWPEPLPTGQHHAPHLQPYLLYNIHILGCTDLLPHSLSKWLKQFIPTHWNYAAKSRKPKLQIRYRPQNQQMIIFAKCAFIKLIQINVMYEIKTGNMLMLHKPNLTLSVVTSPSQSHHPIYNKTH